MSQNLEQIWSYENETGTVNFAIAKISDGIVFQAFIVFDSNTLETTNYATVPFPIERFRQSLVELQSIDEVRIIDSNFNLKLTKVQPDKYNIAYAGGNSMNGFELSNIFINISNVLSRLD